MQRKVNKYLWDMLDAAEAIVAFTDGLSIEEYKGSDLLSSAVERKFEIIGEALKRVLELDPGIEAQIGDCRAIIDFRNRLIHGYDSIDYDAVWTIVKDQLPNLIRDLQKSLNSV